MYCRDDAVLIIAELLLTQDMGHGALLAARRSCECRWCRAHRFLEDNADEVDRLLRPRVFRLTRQIAENWQKREEKRKALR